MKGMDLIMNYKDFIENALSEAYENAPFSDDESLFNIVKERTSNMEKKKLRSKKPAVIAASIGAAAVLTVTAGAIGYNLLSEMFTKYFDDSATKTLADEGYIYTAGNYSDDNALSDAEGQYPTMGGIIEKDIFTAQILGIAGDTQDPMMLVDITINDPGIVNNNSTIGVYTKLIGTEEFEKKRDQYGITYSKGVKDETEPSLYHVSARVPPYWITGGEEFVFDIVSIHTLADDSNTSGLSLEDRTRLGIPTEGEIIESYILDEEISDFGLYGITYNNFFSKVQAYNVDMQFRFAIPENVLKEAPENWYDLSDDLVYEADDIEFRLCYSEFGAHHSYFSLACGIRESMEDYLQISGRNNAQKFAGQFVLTVDGVEYTPDIERANTFRDTKGGCSTMIENMCYLNLEFPPVDYENAQSITLSANGVSYDLKPTD